MSLRTEFLDELNALAKSKDVPALVAKMREVMVDRHPATLSSEEQDPVETVALAWKEVAARGRQSFEAAALLVVTSMEDARVAGNASGGDWPLVHAILRLLRMLPPDLPDPALRAQIVRRLSGTVAERQELITLMTGAYPNATTLWTDAFRLYLAWHDRQPAWLDVLWSKALLDEQWPLNDGAAVFIEEAARRHADFVTMDRLVAFWRAALRRNEATADLKRWFYIIGASLEETPSGRETLVDLHKQFGGHLHDQRHDYPKERRNHFVEMVSMMFRNPAKQERIRSFKSSTKTTATDRERHMAISSIFKAAPNSVNPDLISSLLSIGDIA